MRAVEKDTKVCLLKILLVNNTSIEGSYHVSARTSSAIRPSDALRDSKDGFVILTNVTIRENGETRQLPSVMVLSDSIAYIELPSAGWATRPAREKQDLKLQRAPI